MWNNIIRGLDGIKEQCDDCSVYERLLKYWSGGSCWVGHIHPSTGRLLWKGGGGGGGRGGRVGVLAYGGSVFYSLVIAWAEGPQRGRCVCWGGGGG